MSLLNEIPPPPEGGDDYIDSRVEKGGELTWVVYLKKPLDDDGHPEEILTVDAVNAPLAREKAITIMQHAGMSELDARDNIKDIIGDIHNRPDIMRD